MATEDDQPRPDLDAAIDAVVPSLTAISDDTTADSLRQTRNALARDGERLRHRSSAAAWRWALAATSAAAAAVLAIAAVVTLRPGQQSRAALIGRPLPAAVAAAAQPRVEGMRLDPPVVVRRVTSRPSPAVRATSIAVNAPAPASPPHRDPLAAIVRAVQAIPEEAWARAAAASDGFVPPLATAPLETPAITDPPIEPVAPGEP
jgi:hypothetical protein